jgi:hypothetical protein
MRSLVLNLELVLLNSILLIQKIGLSQFKVWLNTRLLGWALEKLRHSKVPLQLFTSVHNIKMLGEKQVIDCDLVWTHIVICVS